MPSDPSSSGSATSSLSARTLRRRAVIVFSLGPEVAEREIREATEAYGCERFAIDYIHRLIREWVARELRTDIDEVRALRLLIDQLSERAAAYENELRAIHTRELLEAKRRGHR